MTDSRGVLNARGSCKRHRESGETAAPGLPGTCRGPGVRERSWAAGGWRSAERVGAGCGCCVRPSESRRRRLPRPGPASPPHSWAALRTWHPRREHPSSGPFARCCQMLTGGWEPGRNVLAPGQVETGLRGRAGRGERLPAFAFRSRWRLWGASSKPWVQD